WPPPNAQVPDGTGRPSYPPPPLARRPGTTEEPGEELGAPQAGLVAKRIERLAVQTRLERPSVIVRPGCAASRAAKRVANGLAMPGDERGRELVGAEEAGIDDLADL